PSRPSPETLPGCPPGSVFLCIDSLPYERTSGVVGKRHPADLPITSLPAVPCCSQGITTGGVMQLTDLKVRIKRLEGLAKGLAREVELQRGGEDVLLFGERKQYLAGIQDALAGTEAARVVLAGVVKRIEGR